MRALAELAAIVASVVTIAGFYITHFKKRRSLRRRALERLNELEERDRLGQLPPARTYEEREEQR